MKFPESALAHKLLDGLEGIEIGGSAHNQWGLKTRNVDYTRERTVFKEEEIRVCGRALPVDIVAPGDQLPLPDSSVDFVISSHAIEHFPDPIKALKEWHRVVRPGGFIFVIAPHKERTFDKDRERTTLAELIARHETGDTPDAEDAHCSVWITQDFVDLVNWLKWPIVAVQDKDDKVGNGFTVVMKVEKAETAQAKAAPAYVAPAYVARTRPPLSINFILGATGNTRTGGPACVLEYAKRLEQRGHRVSITTWPKFVWPNQESPFPGLDFDVPIYYDKSARREGLPWNLVNQSPRNDLGELTFFTAYMNMITPAIPTSDLIIAANWESIMPAWQSCKGKVVHFPQHYDEVFFTLEGGANASLQGNALIKMLCRNSFEMPVYRIANSTWLAKEIERRFGETVPVVTHGIDSARFHSRPKLSERDGILRVATYSRPDKWKGFQDAVPAMGVLMKQHPGKIEWHVYGFAHEIGPDNSLAPYTFHGALKHDDLSKLYAESDIVLCPSWYESFPLPPIEAMACGTAVVTTKYGTEDYAIDGHTAIVVRPRVLTDFVLALDALVRNPELRARLAKNGRAMAESLTWEAAVAAREELLWRIHQNQMPNGGFHGFDTAILDGHGRRFEHVVAEFAAANGELLSGADGKQYVVEADRLRRVADLAALGMEVNGARPVDLLTLLRSEQGVEITSAANYYGGGAR